MKVKEAIRFIIDSTKDIYSPGESESIALIILHSAGFPRKKIFLHPEDMLENSMEEFVRNCAGELRQGKPVQYILGETEFYGLRFRVNRDVLIPRQETEELVNMIIRENKHPSPKILDLGTGSGCIAIALAKNIPGAEVHATDISEKALEIAGENARVNDVKVIFHKDDMLHGKPDSIGKYQIIVSNPPYVRKSEKALMHPNVLDYEPDTALFVNDADPLVFYKAIEIIARSNLSAGGALYMEINEALGFETAGLFLEPVFTETHIIRDIHEKDRFIKTVKQ